MTLNLFRYFTLPHIFRERGNNFLAITGICLGVAVFVAIEITNQSTLTSFRKSMDSIAGKATIQLDCGEAGMPEHVMLNLIDVPGIENVAPVVQAYPVTSGSEPEIILVQGIDILREGGIREYATGKGSMAGFKKLMELIEPNALALSRSFAEKKRLKVNDRLTLNYNQVQRTMVIKMLLDEEGPALALGGNFALMDIASAQEAFDKIGYLDRIDIVSASGFSIDTLIEDITSRIPSGIQVKRPAMRNRQIENMLASFQINLKILSYIAILVGAFLIYNTINVSVERRMQEIAMMRSLGASRLQIYGMILQEATILGLAGSIIGIVLGLLLAKSAISLVSKTISSVYLLISVNQVVLTKEIIALGLVIGLLCTILSSLVPARRASSIKPHIVVGIYDSHATQQSPSFHLKLILLSLLFFLSVILCAYLSKKKADILFGYLSALLIVGGFTTITPTFIKGCLCFVRPLIERYFAIPGKFSLQNLLQSLPRVSVATAALMASLAMLISIAIMVESFRETVYIWTVQTLKADLYVTSAIRFSRGTGDRMQGAIEGMVKGIEGVAQTGPYRFMLMNYNNMKIGCASQDFDVFIQRGNIWFKNRGNTKEILENTREADGVLISENLELKYGLKEGDYITLNTPTGRRSFLIHGIYYDYSNDVGVVLMDRGLYKRVWNENYISTLGVYLHPHADAKKVAQSLRKAVGTSDYLLIMRGQELRDKAMETFKQSFRIFFALEIIAMIIALLGITNSLIISIMHRQREIAVLRSIGALKKQIRHTIILEAVFMGLIGNILGIFAGVAISFIMIFIITKQSFGWSIQYSPQALNLIMSIGPVLIISMLAGHIPAHKAAGTPLAKALRYE
ncbi:MAG: FtsX-like permease family protein [bacterium]